MVNVHLNVDGSTFLFLSIPDSDVRRLSIRPFKWLRFVMFSICGTHGHLSMMPDGPAIDYNSTSLNGIVDLRYEPSGNFIFVDYEGLNDQATSTVSTDYPGDFRDNIAARDGSACVVTRSPAEHCHPAHLIPRIKGDEGEVAFLKTPNYELDPTDIPRVDLGQVCEDHFTLQYLKEPRDYNPAAATEVEDLANPVSPFIYFALGSNLDAVFQGTSNASSQPGGTSRLGAVDSLPHTIILDYMYGVAAYKQWGSKDRMFTM
ncbi:hypothetical protein EDB89DRAFT_1904173 [Lactarius sanguifluus]|nr:hypothetical protein EDB89DRAFT_1904173 [Lactarius sanguifluus]